MNPDHFRAILPHWFCYTVIELACEEYGADKIDVMVEATYNGKSLSWFENPEALAKQMKIKGTEIVTIKIKQWRYKRQFLIETSKNWLIEMSY